MRKLFAAVLTLCLVSVMGPALFAGSITVSSMTASVAFSGTGVVNVGLQLMNITGGTTNQIWWDPTKIIGDIPGAWVGAGAYIVLSSTLTATGCGIEIYTDNLAVDANPQSSLPPMISSGAANPAGLVDMHDGTNTLGTCWRVAFTPLSSVNIIQGTLDKTFPLRLWDTSTGDQYPCYLWMMDRNTYGFADGIDYVTIRDANRGIQHGEATWCATGATVYLYFGATFNNVKALPDTFQTSTMRIEAFTQ